MLCRLECNCNPGMNVVGWSVILTFLSSATDGSRRRIASVYYFLFRTSPRWAAHAYSLFGWAMHSCMHIHCLNGSMASHTCMASHITIRNHFFGFNCPLQSFEIELGSKWQNVRRHNSPLTVVMWRPEAHNRIYTSTVRYIYSYAVYVTVHGEVYTIHQGFTSYIRGEPQSHIRGELCLHGELNPWRVTFAWWDTSV